MFFSIAWLHPVVLNRTSYPMIPIYIQMLRGNQGHVHLVTTMAVILPAIIAYMFCQKYIIKGVSAGAVKG